MFVKDIVSGTHNQKFLQHQVGRELHVTRLKITFYNKNKEPTFNAKELRTIGFPEHG